MNASLFASAALEGEHDVALGQLMQDTKAQWNDDLPQA
jgi:hypothetical protein